MFFSPRYFFESLASLIRIIEMLDKTSIATVILVLILGFTPFPADAEVDNFTFSIPAYSGESFESLMRQAESAAQRAIIQKFNQDLNLTELHITVLGEYNGQVVPLIASAVSRSNWQALPDIKRWTEYLNISYTLLGFGDAERSDSAVASEPVTVAARTVVDPMLEIIQAAEASVDEGRMSSQELTE